MSDTNVAEILHNIAAESDTISGQIIKQAEAAAKLGKSFILVAIDEDDFDSVYNQYMKPTPPMERLQQLGFKLQAIKVPVWWCFYDSKCPYPYLKVSW